MSPEVVSLPTADERKRMEQQGRPVMEQVYTEKVGGALPSPASTWLSPFCITW